MHRMSLLFVIPILVAMLGCVETGNPVKPGEPEVPTCKEKIKIIVPEGGNLAELECDAHQIAEVVDKPMPGAQHAQWVVRCACIKAPATGLPL